MIEDRGDRYVLLTTMGDVGWARVFAARLEAEGIAVRLHGEPLGPYPVTIGEMAATQLWVPASRLGEARRVMLEAEVDASFPGDDADDEQEPFLGPQIIAVLVLVVILGILSRVL